MKKKYPLLLFCLVAIFAFKAKAQLNYSFSAVAGAYTANGGTVLHAASVDDATSASTAIGFTFQLGCINYTTFQASSNGVMFLGTTAAGSDAFNNLASGTDVPAIAPLWDDLETGTAGNVNYKLTGVAPNRILTVEWLSMKWNYSGATNCITFQVKLYETSNRIEFIYSQGAGATNSPSASIGIEGLTAGDFYSLNGTGAAPTAVYGTETSSLSTKPATGQIYRWDPVTCSGTPAGGTANASLTSGCTGLISVLSLTGSATGCGLTYQWYSSPNNSTWTAIAGATSSTYTATVSSTTYYYCVTTCSNGGATGTSTSVLVTITANCYTMSNGTVTIASCPFTGSFYDSGGSAGNYSNSENYIKTFTAPAGSCLTITFNSINIESCCDHLLIYDGNSTASTLIGSYNGTTNPASITSSGTSLTFNFTSDGSINYSGWDITISCLSACVGTPAGGTASGTAVSCASGTSILSLSGGSSGCGISYQWQSSPNNSIWTNISGATTVPYTATVAGSTYYHCITTCNNSGLHATSNSVYIVSPAPSNDDCTGAITVTVGNCVNGDVNCATQSLAGCVGTASNDVWYSFVANATSIEISLSASSSFDPVVETFSGTCGGLTSILCDDADYTTGGTNQCKSVSGLIIGSTYYVRVFNYGGVPSTTTFTLCINSAMSDVCHLNYSYSSIATNIEAGVSTVVPGLTDDHLSNALPLGFIFCYDGYMYTQAYVSSNAALVFDAIDPCIPNVSQTRVPAANGLWTGWSISNPIPTTTDYCPQNAILAPWHDIDPANGGTITYATLGTAPNRRFVVYFNAVKQFESSSPCQNTNYDYTGQIKIYETTNVIEIHVQQMNSCLIWNNGQAILGLHDPYGTLAVVPTGYNALPVSGGVYNQYSITNKAWQFTTACSTCLTVLPIDIISYTGLLNGEEVDLNWKTASEINNDYFTIEKSSDGKNFEELLKVKGAGNSTQALNYSAVDYSPLPGTSYYRLSQTDFNGITKRINIIPISNTKDDGMFSIVPNPTNGVVNIAYSCNTNTNAVLKIYDSNGGFVLAKNFECPSGKNESQLNLNSIASGIYMITFNTGDKFYRTKLIKQ